MTDDAPRPRTVALLALAAAAVLALGIRFRPRGADPEPVPTESPVLQEALAPRGTLRGMGDFLTERGAAVGAHLVYLDELEASGVVWATDTVLAASGAAVPGAALAPDLPVAVRRAPPDSGLRPPPRVGLEALASRRWLVVAARTADGPVVSLPGLYAGHRPTECGGRPVDELILGVPAHPALVGGGVFDLDGGLAGLVLPCGDRPAAIAVEAVGRALEEAASPLGVLRRRLGLGVLPLDGGARDYFDVRRGLMVSEVWRGSPADAAGLLPGDVIVRAADDSIGTAARLAALAGTTRLALTIVREGRARRIALTPGADDAPGPEGPSLGSPPAAGRPADRGALLAAVPPGSPLGRAGLRAGDRVLRIGRATIDGPAALGRLLPGDRPATPTFVVYRRGDALRGAWLGR